MAAGDNLVASPEFPVSLKYNTLQFCANVLTHIRSREDNEMGDLGLGVLELMQRFRSVLPEYLDEYYENVTGLCTHLMKYSALAESCSKSGAYKGRRLETLQSIKTILDSLESQPDLLRMMKNMHRQAPR